MSREKYYMAKWEAYKIIGEHQDRVKGVIIDEEALEKLTIFLLSLQRWEINYGHTGNHKENRM